jgi:atypical dual specificity phosphatase
MKISWVEPGLLAASDIPISVADIVSLHAQGIRAILTLTERPLTALKVMEPALFTRLDIALHHIPVIDQHPPTHDQANTIIATIAEAAAQQLPLLVHCHAGVGRTGTALHLYYMAQGHSFAAARAHIRARRIQCVLLSPSQEAFVQSFASALS